MLCDLHLIADAFLPEDDLGRPWGSKESESAAARTAHRKKFFACAKEALPVIGGAAFPEAFRQNLQPMDKEGVAVADSRSGNREVGNSG